MVVYQHLNVAGVSPAVAEAHLHLVGARRHLEVVADLGPAILAVLILGKAQGYGAYVYPGLSTVCPVLISLRRIIGIVGALMRRLNLSLFSDCLLLIVLFVVQGHQSPAVAGLIIHAVELIGPAV